MPGIQWRSPEGKAWTFKEIVQGRMLGHPSHALFVHFPVAFYIGAVGFDIVSRVGHFPTAPLTASWLILAAWAGSIPSVITGLVDWSGMVRGSKKRAWATRHMVLQLITAAIFVVNFAMRWSNREQAKADVAWIAVGLFGVAVLSVGQWMGGVLVYEMGMRVSTGASRSGDST